MARGGAEDDVRLRLTALLRGTALLIDNETRTGAGGNGEETSVTKCLLANLKACGSFLQSHHSTLWNYVQQTEQELLAMSSCEGTEGSWKFVVRSLVLLRLLCEAVVSQSKLSSPSDGPPTSSLSVAEQKVVETLLQFVVSLGVSPLLEVGVAVSLHTRLKTSSWMPEEAPVISDRAVRTRRLYALTHTLVFLSRERVTFGPLLGSLFLPDVLAALIQLGYEGRAIKAMEKMTSSMGEATPTAVPAVDVCWGGVDAGWPRRALREVLHCVHQPFAVQQLMALQSPKPAHLPGQGEEGAAPLPLPSLVPPPKWLRAACGQLLTELLLKPRGVRAVVEGFVLSCHPAGAVVEWRMFDALGGIVSRCPAKLDPGQYCRKVCPQVLELLDSSPTEQNRELLLAASAIVNAFLTHCPGLAQLHLTRILLEPLMVLAGDCIPESGQVPEVEVAACWKRLCVVVRHSPPQSPLSQLLLPYLPIMLQVAALTDATSSPSQVCLEELVVSLLRQSSTEDCRAAFIHPGTVDDEAGRYKSICASVDVRVTQGGGVVVSVAPPPGEGWWWCNMDHNERLVQLILRLLREELQDPPLLGAVLCDVLEELANIVSTPTPVQTEGVADPSLLSLEDAPVEHPRVKHSQVFCLYLAAALCQALDPTALREAPVERLLTALRTILQAHARVVGPEKEVRVKEERGTGEALFGDHLTLSIATGVLSAMLAVHQSSREVERTLLQSLSSPLELLASVYPIEQLSSACHELHVCIATLGAVWRTEAPSSTSDLLKEVSSVVHSEVKGETISGKPEVSAAARVETGYSKALEEVSDPLPPVRGHGLREMTRLLISRDPDTLEHSDLLVEIFQHQLKDEDDSVYLAAIQGLVALSNARPQQVIPVLVDQFVSCGDRSGPSQQRHDAATGKLLMDGDGSHPPPSRVGVALRLKVAEALVRAARSCGEVLPLYADQFMQAVVCGVRDPDPLVRASSMSHLSELCGLMHFSLPSIIQEALLCVTQVLEVEKEHEVRRAAVLVVKATLSGLGQDAIQVLHSELRGMYRLLRHIECTEVDGPTRELASTALVELDQIMREVLFPQQVLTKEIAMLHPPQ